MPYAARMKHLDSSGIRRMFELAASMKNPIDLSLGQPDFPVPENIKKALHRAVDDNKNGYVMAAGIPPFRDAVAKSLVNEGLNPGAVMATSGASGALTVALTVLADENTDVLVADPAFVSYNYFIRLAGATPVFIDTYPDFKLTPEKIRAAVTPKSKILLFNAPNNPTGVAYTDAELRALAATTRELGLQVIADEVYDQFCYDFPFKSWLHYDSEALLVRTLGKTWGMPGWRLGLAAGPKDLIENMIMVQQVMYVCMHTASQWAGIEALTTDMSEAIGRYKVKRDFVYSALKPHFNCAKPEGAFYIFPEAPRQDTEAFFKKCVENNILMVPGKAFSVKNTHFRISYATHNESLKKGVETLIKIADQMKAE